MSSENLKGVNGPITATEPSSQSQTASTSVVESISVPNGDQNATQDNATKHQKSSKKDRQQVQSPNTEQNMAEAAVGVKLTGAQLKKQKAAEKAARRAEKVSTKGEEAIVEQQIQARTQSQAQVQAQAQAQTGRRPSQSGRQGSDQLGTPQQQHRRKPSNQPSEPGAIRIPFRPGGLQQLSTPQTQQSGQKLPTDKRVPLVSHLYTSSTKSTTSSLLTSAPREIHPSILTLALHLRSLTLTGSTARTLSLLLTLKRVIQAYTTPPLTALSRHLTTHLSHQITFLSSAGRPLGIAQGNAVRWLKKLISQLDPDLDDADAKNFLRESIDSYVREKVTFAADVIATQASTRIADSGDTILVFGKSSLVERTLLRAAREEGKRFKVVVADSRPLLEGRNLARSLLRAGMREGGNLPGCSVVYTLISGLADVLEQENVTKCLLGASGMLGNGGLYSRCGTAMVAMMAKQQERNVPVIVVAESVKFTGKMAVDSLSLNEIGDADALIERTENTTFTTDISAATKTDDSSAKKGGGNKKKEDDTIDENEETEGKGPLDSWRDTPNLYLLNLMYDVTPKDLIDMVICELGTLPPGGVPVVNGVHGGDE